MTCPKGRIFEPFSYHIKGVQCLRFDKNPTDTKPSRAFKIFSLEGRRGREGMSSGWKSKGWGSNPGTSRQPVTPSCLKQQILQALMMKFARDTLKDKKTHLDLGHLQATFDP